MRARASKNYGSSSTTAREVQAATAREDPCFLLVLAGFSARSVVGMATYPDTGEWARWQPKGKEVAEVSSCDFTPTDVMTHVMGVPASAQSLVSGAGYD